MRNLINTVVSILLSLIVITTSSGVVLSFDQCNMNKSTEENNCDLIKTSATNCCCSSSKNEVPDCCRFEKLSLKLPEFVSTTVCETSSHIQDLLFENHVVSQSYSICPKVAYSLVSYTDTSPPVIEKYHSDFTSILRI
ncbi:MAG TPA: hypothetical protein PKH65_08220 [Bacteroidia bacterium]|nr:hypothetical protein [Bacteroidia bacterium]HNT80652.1 hypothetical protein [Bacteroidia bacterium]